MFLIPRMRVSLARSSFTIKGCLDCAHGQVKIPFRHSKRVKSFKDCSNFQFARFITCSRVYCEESTVNSSNTSCMVSDSDYIAAAPSEEFIAKLNEESNRLLKILRIELEVFRQSGYQVPEKISDERWKDILENKSKVSRIKFYRYLCITEHRARAAAEKKATRRVDLEKHREERQQLAAEKPFDGLEYGLSKNTLFLRFTRATQNAIHNLRLCQAMSFGQKLVLDLGYCDNMTKREHVNCADQISEVLGSNREDRDPFDIHICNFARDTNLERNMLKAIPNLYLPSCLINVTEKSYLDLFPKEKLVYLTPDCREDLDEFDHESIYIIGGLVDKSPTGPLSLAKAKKEKLRMARLPVEKYLDWGMGNKSFTLDQMVKMLLGIKNTGDWNKAFLHVPRRKLRRDIENIPYDRKDRKRRLYGPR